MSSVSTERLNEIVNDEVRNDRGAEWCAIYDTLREFRLSNMVFEGEDDAYCLVDLVSNEGCDISTGEEQLLMLADEISIAIRTSKAGEVVAWVDPRTIQVLAERRRWATAILTNQQGENATMPLYASPTPAATAVTDVLPQWLELLDMVEVGPEPDEALALLRSSLTAALEVSK